ncbi:MAG: hypothetical protein ACRD97_02295, partial [Nitrososphaeraceae archaeon]
FRVKVPIVVVRYQIVIYIVFIVAAAKEPVSIVDKVRIIDFAYIQAKEVFVIHHRVIVCITKIFNIRPACFLLFIVVDCCRVSRSGASVIIVVAIII